MQMKGKAASESGVPFTEGHRHTCAAGFGSTDEGADLMLRM